MYRTISLLFISFLLFSSSYSQTVRTTNTSATSPKLVVGLVIDQMRWDYLYKYAAHYGNGGFKRLLQQGFSCDNAMITHLPTYTAVGHAGIYTGSYPSIHGIVGNNWYDRISGKSVYCTDDSTVSGVGSSNDAGKMSPRNLLTTTITDQLRLHNNFKSKVIGISLKDRGAIIPAGHSANAAYWFDDKEGLMISSSFYMQSLPNWVKDFNAKKWPDVYMSKDWTPLLKDSDYQLSTQDNTPFEGNIPGFNAAVFPYHLGAVTDKKYRSFRFTPYGNSYVLKFAEQAVLEEKLGTNTVADFLAVSLSSTDYIGHTFGPNSIEMEDTYLRLDRDIESFLNFLDKNIGKGKYLLFLTADHGVAHNPNYMKEVKIPAGNFEPKELSKEINKQLNGFPVLVDHIENSQLYLKFNKEMADSGYLPTPFALSQTLFDKKISNWIIPVLESKEYITQAVDLRHIDEASLPAPLIQRLKNSYHSKRSGDIQYIPNPAWLEGNGKGTTHGLWNPYDAHIPLVWFGWNIKQGNSHREVHMSDIAPTLAALLQIQVPNGSLGEVIVEVVK